MCRERERGVGGKSGDGESQLEGAGIKVRERRTFAYKSFILGAGRCSFTSTVASNTRLSILNGTFLFLLTVQNRI